MLWHMLATMLSVWCIYISIVIAFSSTSDLLEQQSSCIQLLLHYHQESISLCCLDVEKVCITA